MKLYFGGCSSTYGQGLADPVNESWPTLVSKNLGFEFLNNAVPGSSNQRTVLHSIQNIDKFDYFFIQWAKISRFTLSDPENQWEVNFNQSLNNNHYRNQDKFKTFSKYYYTYWENPYYDYVNYLSQVILLQSFFKSRNKPYLMLVSDTIHAMPFPHNLEKLSLLDFKDRFKRRCDITHLTDSLLESMCDKVNHLIGCIDKSTFIDNGNFNMETATPTLTECRHPTSEGHRITADTVLAHFKNQML